MKKRLKFSVPDIQTYVYELYPLGIMDANGDEYKEWMLSNYVQLNSHDDIITEKEVFLAFYDDVGMDLCQYSRHKNSNFYAVFLKASSSC